MAAVELGVREGLLHCLCDCGPDKIARANDRGWGSALRWAAVWLLVTCGYLYVVTPYRNLSYAPTAQFDYTYRIEPQCRAGTDPQVVAFLQRQLTPNPWSTLFGCKAATPVKSMSVFIAFFAVVIVALWCLISSPGLCHNHNRICYAWVCTPCAMLVPAWFVSCSFLIVAYRWTRINSDTEMCVPLSGEYTPFGDVINQNFMFTDQTAASPGFTNVTEYLYLRDIAAPQCVAVQMRVSIPDRWFTIRYQPNPELEQLLRSTASSVWNNAVSLVAFTPLMCLIGDPLLTYMLTKAILKQTWAALASALCSCCCCCCSAAYWSNLCRALVTTPPPPPIAPDRKPDLATPSIATPPPGNHSLYPQLPQLSRPKQQQTKEQHATPVVAFAAPSAPPIFVAAAAAPAENL